MKKFIIITLILCFGILYAGTKVSYLLISWEENTDLDLAGYNLYYSQDSTNLHIKINCGLNDEWLLIDKIDINTWYYFAVTAYDSVGNESNKSKIIPYIYTDESDTTSPLIPIIKYLQELEKKGKR